MPTPVPTVTAEYTMATPTAQLLAQLFEGPDRVQLVFSTELGVFMAALLGAFWVASILREYGVIGKVRRWR